jgi:SPP1 family predicted phage head-tail adaptor
MTGRPGAFSVGDMRERITIQQETVTVDSIGQPTRAWATLYSDQPAKWMPTAGTETIRGRSVEAGVVAVFTIRARTGITPQMQVVHRSGTYGIGYVKQVAGRDRYIELHCKQAVA